MLDKMEAARDNFTASARPNTRSTSLGIYVRRTGSGRPVSRTMLTGSVLRRSMRCMEGQKGTGQWHSHIGRVARCWTVADRVGICRCLPSLSPPERPVDKISAAVDRLVDELTEQPER